MGLCIIALVQFQLQNNPSSHFCIDALSTLMLVAYGGKAALSALIGFVLLLFPLTLASGNAAGINLVVSFMSGLLWALLVATFVAVLLEDPLGQINTSRDLDSKRGPCRLSAINSRCPQSTWPC